VANKSNLIDLHPNGLTSMGQQQNGHKLLT